MKILVFSSYRNLFESCNLEEGEVVTRSSQVNLRRDHLYYQSLTRTQVNLVNLYIILGRIQPTSVNRDSSKDRPKAAGFKATFPSSVSLLFQRGKMSEGFFELSRLRSHNQSSDLSSLSHSIGRFLRKAVLLTDIILYKVLIERAIQL